MIQPLKILIGEDDPIVAQALRVQLESLGHQVVAVAHDGREVVAKAQSLDPAIAILDIKMPRVDGVEAVRQIMAHRPIPILLVTAHSDPEIVEKAMVAGVMGYLVKPIDRKDLGPAIVLAVTRFADLMGLRKDVQSLKDALALRQQVERAKGVLERRMGLTEAEAHRRLQQLARNDRCTMAEAAAKVVAAEKFFTDLERLA